MTMAIMISLLLVFALFWFFSPWSSWPYVHKVCSRDIEKYLNILLRQGYDGGLMFINVDKRSEFIQFVKYISGDEVRLQTGFPIARWSEKYEERLISVLAEHSFPYEITEVGKSPSVSRFYDIDFRNNASDAARYGRVILAELFDIGDDSIVKVHFENVGPDDEWLAEARKRASSKD